MKTKKIFNVLLLSSVIVLSSCQKDSPSPIDPADPVVVLDCNGIDGGTAKLDDCGTCNLAYAYNMITHTVEYLDDTAGIVLVDPTTSMIVMPGDFMDRNWNSECYTFTTDAAWWATTTESYGGQTARLNMAAEMMGALASSSTTEDALNGMFSGTGSYFSDPSLNASTKNIVGKVGTAIENAISSAEQASLISKFQGWFADYANNVAPIIENTEIFAAPGTAGWAENRELNAKGMEYDQIIAKSLIGSLCLDQVVNGYLSQSKIGDQVSNERPADGGYTDMEHHWDEGYGYVYGKMGPNNSGDLSADGLLGKYLNKFTDHKATVFNAFIDGRQAIVEKNSAERDVQAQIIKVTLSKVVALKAIGYLTDAAVANDLSAPYFHALSEGYGFILSLQFTYNENGAAYFTHDEVNVMLETLEAGNGFWDRTDDELINMAATISLATGL